jgi:hypothetical protein
MRLGQVALVLAVCSLSCTASAQASRRPAWPKPAAHEVDGGESLAPRAAARAIAAVVAEDRPTDKPAVDKPAAATPAAAAGVGTDKPAASPSAPPAADEPITTEEIVIEIED